MYISCWNCGNDIWLETQYECRHCHVAARRCVDCINFDPSRLYCRALGIEIGEAESVNPTTLAVSFRCASYQQSPEAAERAAQKKAQRKAGAAEPQPAVTTTAPEAPSVEPTTTPPPQPQQEVSKAPAPTKRPMIIAHRGDPSQAPENTVAAVKKAIEIGVDVVEFDVHVSKDGHLVAIHDATLERTTDGFGPVAAYTLDDLKKLDAGAWFSEEFRGEPIPTIGEMIAAIPAPTWINIHLKSHENESDRVETALVDAVHEAGVVGRTYITHHTRHGLHRIHQKEPKLRLSWLPRGGEQDVEYVDDAFYMGFRIIQPNFRIVNKRFMDYAHQRGMWVNVFWADDEEHMRELAEIGVDGILTNYPARLKKVLAEMGAADTTSPGT